MTPEWLLRHAIEPALAILPWKMSGHPAWAMLLAIALQESRIEHRRQIGGPARGFWQFERSGGVAGVLSHQATAGPIRSALDALSYPAWHWTPELCYKAIEHNDVLAAAFARCLLWTFPQPLPGPQDHDEGWRQYAWAWRPGKPHRQTWDGFYRQAWAANS